jgi:tetratricopeptide (TPR) repeat protein
MSRLESVCRNYFSACATSWKNEGGSPDVIDGPEDYRQCDHDNGVSAANGSLSVYGMKMIINVRRIAVLFISSVLMVSIGLAQAHRDGSSSIIGTVHDGSGIVGDASVRLQAEGTARAEERKTDASGGFGFSRLKMGTYVLSASKGERHSSEVTVTLTVEGAVQRVELTLSSESGSAEAPQMEYSDAPIFTVSAVTDWTAAGGHGSDTNLRTSEALNRETVRLKPESTSALPPASERDLRAALEKSPGDLKANEDLGRFYLSAERYSDAIAALHTAYSLDASNQGNEFDLALALARTGDTVKAREHLSHLLSNADRPEWHRLSGEIAEKSGDSLSAVREFERAAKEDPSEENYFAWGSELLEHRAIWQAKEVFESGAKAYPHSARMLTALGAALFGGALYEDAARRFCEASDLLPTDAKPYLFMGKVELAAPNSLPCIETKLQRFVRMQPSNPIANLYYAMSYWKEHGRRVDTETLAVVESYLQRAVKADPKCSDAYLDLGILNASRTNFKAASEFYRQAIAADAQSTEAHYRLGVAYDRLGDREKAADEFRLHDELEKKQAAAVDEQRKEVKQFLVQLGGNGQDRSARP